MVFLKCTLKSKKLSHSLFEFFRFFDYLSKSRHVLLASSIIARSMSGRLEAPDISPLTNLKASKASEASNLLLISASFSSTSDEYMGLSCGNLFSSTVKFRSAELLSQRFGMIARTSGFSEMRGCNAGSGIGPGSLP